MCFLISFGKHYFFSDFELKRKNDNSTNGSIGTERNILYIIQPFVLGADASAMISYDKLKMPSHARIEPIEQSIFFNNMTIFAYIYIYINF